MIPVVSMARSSFAATLALASASRLRAPRTPPPSRLLTTSSGAPSKKLQSTPRSRGPPSATRSSADRGRSAPRQQTSPTPLSPSLSPLLSIESSSSHGKRPLLQPYELSRRLIGLCEQGDVDLAVTAIQRAPRNAQNIKVWNTIIQQCMNAKKYNLAYSVFTDMKRRGFMPNVRTYATMMGGYATVDDWRPFTKQLELVHSVYDQLKQTIEETRGVVDDPAGDSGASFILYPIALYITILGKAGWYQRAFDVFHGLDTDGPLAPHPKIYSSLLSILADRVHSVEPDGADQEAVAQSVSEAKYIWRRHMRSLDKQPQHVIDPRAVDAMMKILSRGGPSDHELMFDILRDICGLPRPGEQLDHSSGQKKKVKVSPSEWILYQTLDGCIAARRPDMAVHYAQSVMNARHLRRILQGRHLHRLLWAQNLLAEKEQKKAQGQASASASESPSRAENAAVWVEWMLARVPRSEKSKPSEHSLVSALELCYRCKDMPSALRIVRAALDSEGRPPVYGGGSLPVKVWERLLRVATVAPPDEQRQCLELLNAHGLAVLDVWESTSAVQQLAPPEKMLHESLARYIVQVLQTVLPSPDHEGAESTDAAGLKAWSNIRRRADSFFKKIRRRKDRPGSTIVF